MGSRSVWYRCGGVSGSHTYVDSLRILVLATVYEPSDDSWLALDCVADMDPGDCVDVGTGTGILGLAGCSSYRVLIDINPCSLYNAVANAEVAAQRHLVDVAQCDNVSCLRCTSYTYIFNTPYLPVEDEGLEGLSWSGGLREAIRLIEFLSGCSRHCIILVYSSLSGDHAGFEELLAKKGYRIKCRRIKHVFFEDIVAVGACRYDAKG